MSVRPLLSKARANKLPCQVGHLLLEAIINQCANEPLWNVQDLL